MHHRLSFAVLLVLLTLTTASPASVQLQDKAVDRRVSFHFLVRHENRAAVNGSPYSEAERTVGLWQPPSREELARSRDARERDLHAHTVPLVEMNW